MGDGPFMNMYMFVYLCVNVGLSVFLCGYINIMRSYLVQKPLTSVRFGEVIGYMHTKIYQI